MNYVSIKDNEDVYIHYAVPPEVYVYVKQLEHYIKYPEESKLMERYGDRLKKGCTHKGELI